MADKTTGTNTTGTDDNSALVLSKLQALAVAAHEHAKGAAKSYDDDHQLSLWHAGQAFLFAAEATGLQERHAAQGGERLGPHDNAASDVRAHAQLAAAATEGAWEGDD